MFEECIDPSVSFKCNLFYTPHYSAISGMHIGSKIGEFVGSLISSNIVAEVAQGDYSYLFPDPELERALKEAASIRAEYITDICKNFIGISGYSLGLLISIPIIMPIQIIDEALQYGNITNFDITETIYDSFAGECSSLSSN
jgi:hypothetical protein